MTITVVDSSLSLPLFDHDRSNFETFFSLLVFFPQHLFFDPIYDFFDHISNLLVSEESLNNLRLVKNVLKNVWVFSTENFEADRGLLVRPEV